MIIWPTFQASKNAFGFRFVDNFRRFVYEMILKRAFCLCFSFFNIYFEKMFLESVKGERYMLL